MLSITDGYKTAIVGDVRRMLSKAILDLVDPDIVYGVVASSGAAAWSKPEQLYDREMDSMARYATLETGRWLLDGTFRLIPDDPDQLTGEVGFVGDVLSGDDGSFASPVYAELTFTNVYILQACSVYFSDDAIDGIAEDFTVAVYSGDTAVYTKDFTGNTEPSASLDGFTVYDPTAIRVTVTKWSLPGRRLRVAEIIPGLYEEWTGDVLASIDIQMRGNFACLAIPYGTCTLRMDNIDRRVEPRNPNGVFQSIEERQAIPVAIGCELADGTVEYKRAGVFYQANGGWKTGDNAMTMQWDLVDIVGLLADREFKAPDTLPTTLAGWLASIVGQLGDNFADKYHVDLDYADAAATVSDASDVEGKKCGDLLRWVCMATGTWPRADAETGDLTAEPFWSQGNKLDLDNMTVYPVMKANDDLAVLTFQLYDDAKTVVNISGNATSSYKTLTVSNPFIHTAEQAQTAARQILSQYGGIKLETTGRGDPAGEIGDVDTVWLDESRATTGRRMEQSFTFSNGVLRDCKSVLLQADGSFLFENRVVFTESGVFHTGPNQTQARIILSQGGQGGARGGDGYVGGSGVLPGQDVSSGDGDTGLDGSGGKIWSGVVNVNPDTDYTVVIGKGGKASAVAGVPGAEGEETTFGVYSSANGKVYSPSYTDIASGDAYGRTGVALPKSGTGDGGAGGKGGSAGSGYWVQDFWPDGRPKGWNFKVASKPGPGLPGVDGADGVCVIYWDKE